MTKPSMARISLLLLMLSTSGVLRAEAQAPAAPLDSGTTVRLQTASRRIEGRLLRPVTAASAAYELCLTPRVDCTETTNPRILERVPRGDVTRVEVQRGNRMTAGVIAGSLLGAALGIGAAGFVNGFSDCTCGQWRRTAAGAAGGALVGMLLGALIGGTTPAWEEVP